MRIIKRGNILIEINKKEIECNNCHSILEYVQEDIYYDDRPWGDAYLICPVCNKLIYNLKDNGR